MDTEIQRLSLNRLNIFGKILKTHTTIKDISVSSKNAIENYRKYFGNVKHGLTLYIGKELVRHIQTVGTNNFEPNIYYHPKFCYSRIY